MDRERKQELAELDDHWNFEKKIPVYRDNDWEKALKNYNKIQQKNGDIYMTVSKMSAPSLADKTKLWWRTRRRGYSETTTFHHRQVYRFYQKLATRMDTTVARAIYLCDSRIDRIKDELDLEQSIEVDFIDVENTGNDSKVDTEDLKEMIDDGKN